MSTHGRPFVSWFSILSWFSRLTLDKSHQHGWNTCRRSTDEGFNSLMGDSHCLSRKSNWSNGSLRTSFTLHTQNRNNISVSSGSRVRPVFSSLFNRVLSKTATFNRHFQSSHTLTGSECNYLLTRGANCSWFTWQPLCNIIEKKIVL